MTTASRLEGTWVGRPETSVERAERSPRVRVAPAGGQSGRDAPALSASLDPGAGDAPPVDDGLRTDLESVDVQITLEMRPGGELSMWRGNRLDPLDGAWRVVSAEGDRVVLELTAQRTEAQERNEEKRRFRLTFAPNADAFTLREEGADRLFGALYFRRQE